MDWRIFFIGPMPSDGGDRFDRMIEAVVAELGENGYQAPEPGEFRLTEGKVVNSLVLTRTEDQDEVTLLKPHDLISSSSIARNVFDAIDDADLVIADLTDARPAVIYELAFAHALGIGTIMLAAQSSPSEERLSEFMFYLRGYRHVPVDFSNGDIRSDDFTQAFQAWLAQRNKRFNERNPFTEFYDAPIPDISAANGLANGYYENFLRRLLASGSELVVMSDDSEPSRQRIAGVCVVRPENLRSLPELTTYTGDTLRAAFGERLLVGEPGKVYVDTNGRAGHRTCEFVVDNWLIDVPRTVLTLERSPRLIRASARAGQLTSDVNQPAHDHLSSVLIARFLEGARLALRRDGDIENVTNRFFYGSPEEIISFLELPPDQRPTVWP